MANSDQSLLRNVITCARESKKELLEGIEHGIEYVIDDSIIKALEKLESSFRDEDNDYKIFENLEDVKTLWRDILEKAIKCLRYFDDREPFLNNPQKKPIAYGMEGLKAYFDNYSSFESLLYGGVKYYRDHVIHVFRVWLLGISCLLRNNMIYLKRIEIETGFSFNSLEKLSIWSIIALTHDLGYPLQKAQEIIDRTKIMMKSFVSNPVLSMDLSFSGIQNNMNDFILRFMSSKMRYKSDDERGSNFVVRLQPKYYFKFQKSLEQNQHGILSAIIIYKLLLYFLESDFSINEDYEFKANDARQFYIRREILRAISSHTCRDIYHMNMHSMAFLLIVTDDSQEWGRKQVSELYVSEKTKYFLTGINMDIPSISDRFETQTENKPETENSKYVCTVTEEFQKQEDDKNEVTNLLCNFYRQYDGYKEIFRDGQDTANRNFDFKKESKIVIKKKEDLGNIELVVNISIPNSSSSEFFVTTSSKNSKFLEELLKKNSKINWEKSELGKENKYMISINS